jgi:hypothetical protein
MPWFRRAVAASAGLGVSASAALLGSFDGGGDDDGGGGAKTPGAAAICLFTDLDGTFVEHGKEQQQQVRVNLERFYAYWDRHERPRGSVLVYNTARSIKMYEALPADFPAFRPPDVLITGEGTEIRWLTSPSSGSSASSASSASSGSSPTASSGSSHGHDARYFEFAVDDSWARRIRAHWWDSGLAEKVRAALDAVDEMCIAHLNDPGNALNAQGEARHAVTIRGGPGSEQRAADLLQSLSAKLNGDGGGGGGGKSADHTPPRAVELAGFPAWGEDPKPRIITALPACAGKGKAAQYVAERLGFAEEQCVCAGDTLGDIALLQDAGGMKFFAVANAKGSLKTAVANKRRGVDTGGSFPSVVSCTGAAGVLEGVKRFRAEL